MMTPRRLPSQWIAGGTNSSRSGCGARSSTVICYWCEGTRRRFRPGGRSTSRTCGYWKLREILMDNIDVPADLVCLECKQGKHDQCEKWERGFCFCWRRWHAGVNPDPALYLRQQG